VSANLRPGLAVEFGCLAQLEFYGYVGDLLSIARRDNQAQYARSLDRMGAAARSVIAASWHRSERLSAPVLSVGIKCYDRLNVLR
jgi:hypothetical protein